MPLATTLPLPVPYADVTAKSMARRNTLADQFFYNVSNLSHAEFDRMVSRVNAEGSLLVVFPNPKRTGLAIDRFDNFERFRSAPGELLRHFTIAGVGSSDLGAAALARTLANHVDAPVGAIVAGYGVADLLTEAMGGWYFFGMANRTLAAMARQDRQAGARTGPAAPPDRGGHPAGLGLERTDTRTLLQLLKEPERSIETLLGHSKGCLSISSALQSLARTDPGALDHLRETRVVTTGAVVPLPPGLSRSEQYLGAIDWFGGVNSTFDADFVRVPGAWHHVNTRLPAALDVGAALAGRFG
jgi:hypothetical protein